MNPNPPAPGVPKPSSPPMKPWLIIVLVLVILAAAGYWWFSRSKTATPIPVPSLSTTPTLSPTPTAVLSNSSTAPAGSSSNNSKKSSTVTTSAYEGETARETVPVACNPTVSFNYPKTLNVQKPYSTGTGGVDLTLADSAVTIFVTSVYTRTTAAPNYIPSYSCPSYSSLDDYRSKNGGINSTKTYTTSNGYQAIEYNMTATNGIVFASAIQNPTTKVIITVTTSTLTSTNQSASTSAVTTIADSLKFK